MDGERSVRFVLTCRVVGCCILAGFLLDVLGKSWSVFVAGYPVTLANIYAHSTRAGHLEAWLFSGALCIAFGALALRRFYGALLEGKD